MLKPGERKPEQPTLSEIREQQNAAAEAGLITAIRADTIAILKDLEKYGAAVIGEKPRPGRRTKYAHMMSPSLELGEVFEMQYRGRVCVLFCTKCNREYIIDMPPDIPRGRKPKTTAAIFQPCPNCREKQVSADLTKLADEIPGAAHIEILPGMDIIATGAPELIAMLKEAARKTRVEHKADQAAEAARAAQGEPTRDDLARAAKLKDNNRLN